MTVFESDIPDMLEFPDIPAQAERSAVAHKTASSFFMMNPWLSDCFSAARQVAARIVTAQ
jgi:hypothetical protein